MVDTQEVASSLETWYSGFGVGDVTRWRLEDCLRNRALDSPRSCDQYVLEVDAQKDQLVSHLSVSYEIVPAYYYQDSDWGWF